MRIIILLIITSFIISTPVIAANTYEIIEQDMIEEIQSKSSKVYDRLDNIKKEYRKKLFEKKGVELTAATEDFEYHVDMTYTLKRDITDQNGNILYPAGFTFNPIAFTNIIPPEIIVFNPCKKNEIEKVYELTGDINNYMLVSSGCSVENINPDKKFVRPVYLLTPEMKTRLNIKYTVSVVSFDKGRNDVKIKVYKATVN